MDPRAIEWLVLDFLAELREAPSNVLTIQSEGACIVSAARRGSPASFVTGSRSIIGQCGGSELLKLFLNSFVSSQRTDSQNSYSSLPRNASRARENSVVPCSAPSPGALPSSAGGEEKAQAMARVAAAMRASHGAGGSFSTVRDLYYSDTALYVSQPNAERAIEVAAHALSRYVTMVAAEADAGGGICVEGCRRDVCAALLPHVPLSREALGFGATARSLLVGDVSFVVGADDNDRVRAGAAGARGISISTAMGCGARDFAFGPSSASATPTAAVDIFVVEKECTLTTITRREGGLEGRHYAMPPTHASTSCKADVPTQLFICGKGYPCVAARSLLRRMVEAAVADGITTRVFFVVDGDGDGMLIMLSYVSGLLGLVGGSKGQAQLAASGVTAQSVSLAAPLSTAPALGSLTVEWLGLRPTAASALREGFRATEGHNADASLPISFATDRCLAKIKTISRTANALAKHCEGVLSSPSEDDRHSGSDVRRHSIATPSAAVASAVAAMLAASLPLEVAHFSRTRLKAELQLAHAASAATAREGDIGVGKRRPSVLVAGGSNSANAFDATTTLGLLFSLNADSPTALLNAG